MCVDIKSQVGSEYTATVALCEVQKAVSSSD